MIRKRRHRLAEILALAAAHAAAMAAAYTTAMAATRAVDLPGASPMRVVLEEGRDIVLLARADKGDTYGVLASEFLAEDVSPERLAAANPGRPAVQDGRWYRLPFALLAPPWQEKALRALFPQDGPGPRGWVHRPSRAAIDTYGEGVWEVALWYTGDGGTFRDILRANGLSDPMLSAGREVVIPGPLLREPFRNLWKRFVAQSQRAAAAAAAPPAPPPPAPAAAAPSSAASAREAAAGAAPARSELTFAKDDEGDYATYAIKRGEALYSAVVVRFTGRVDPDDVAGAAEAIAHRSGIRTTTSIPVGYAVKIPRDLLLPEFLPSEDRKHKAIERTRRETARVRNEVRSRNLEGIHVILDAGHGGVDPGALVGGLSEHEYVYDVLCRIKHRLETRTGAVVHPTISDPATGFDPRPGRTLRISGTEKILTTPVHLNDDPDETALGVNLRWYLANAIERRLVASGVSPSKIVFASLHADVLHASLRGAMIYVPGEQYRRGTYGCGSRLCGRYREVREAPSIHFSRSDRVASEGLSRQFAADLLDAFRAHDIAIHPDLPVRDRIIRDGRTWLPAVLRGNSIPVKILLEIANLNNPADRARLQDPEFRESIAHAFTDALLRYYAASSASGPPASKPARPVRTSPTRAPRPTG